MKAVLLLAALALQIEPPAVDATDGRFAAPHGTKAEVLGICDLRPEGVRCWDVKGAPAPDLARRIGDQMRASRSEAVARRGRKNRYLVLSGNPRTEFQLRTMNNEVTSGTLGPDLVSFAVFLAPDAARFDASLSLLDGPDAPHADIPFVRGRPTEALGVRFEVGAATTYVVRSPFARRPRTLGQPEPRSWSFVWGQRGPVVPNVQWRYEPQDGKGRPIEYLDAQGRPITEAVYRAALVKSDDPYLERSERGYVRATMHPNFSDSVPGALRLVTNVDPAALGAIRATRQEWVRVRFPNLPADPAPEAAR